MQSVVWVLVLVAVAQVWADDDHGCGVAERLGVAHDWAEAYSSGKERQKFGTITFHKFLKTTPEAHKLFERVRGDNILSVDFQSHIARVMGGLDMAISLLQDRATLKDHVEHLNHQHQDMGIPDEYFASFGKALLETLPRFVHDHRPNIDAWRSCYNLLVQGITAKAEPAADAAADAAAADEPAVAEEAAPAEEA